MACVYIIKNKISQKMYVGITTYYIKKRLHEHLKEKGKQDQYIDNALQKEGLENFDIFSFLVEKTDLNYVEIKLIKELNTLYPNGYNFESGGGINKSHHPLTKQKQSESHSGGNNYWFGKHLSEEHKDKLSKSKTSTKCLEETKQKISKGNKGKYIGKDHPMARKVICLETKEIFDTAKEASIKYNISHIGNCCKGKQKSAGKDSQGNKLHWMYYSEYLKIK
jgi:group I intron endonuclease